MNFMANHKIHQPPYSWPILQKSKKASWEICHKMAPMLQAFINNHALNSDPNILMAVRNCQLLQFLIVSHPSGEDNTWGDLAFDPNYTIPAFKDTHLYLKVRDLPSSSIVVLESWYPEQWLLSMKQHFSPCNNILSTS